MSPLMTTLALYAPFVLIGVLLVSVSVIMWRRALGDDRPLLLGTMLRRQGADVPDPITRSAGHDYSVAVRRCLNCAVSASCGKWLEEGRKEGYEEFCPNAGYIEGLKRAA
jgi:hypothetical protein